MEEKIDIPVQVLHDLEFVRQEGLYNMFGGTDVVARMNELGFYSSFLWFIDIEKVETTGSVKVDYKKYFAALQELGNIKELADKLSN